MGITRLYVCDGDAEGCEKTYCKFAGRGECSHTTQRGHARYGTPRKWEHLWAKDPLGNEVYVEKEREC